MLLAEGLHLGAALGVDLIDPKLERVEHRHRDAGIGAGAGVQRADLDLGRGGLCALAEPAAARRKAEPSARILDFIGCSLPASSSCNAWHRDAAHCWRGL